MVRDSDHRRRGEHDEREPGSEPAGVTPEPHALLRLQALVGNQGVVRFLAARGAPAARSLQRLVGFEAELSVPTMPAPPSTVTDAFPTDGRKPTGGKGPTGAVEGFLRGGLPYGTSAALGDGAGTHFHLAADHNRLRGRHSAIRDTLEEERFKIPKRRRSMSNLEFVTPPLDELAPSSTKQLMAQFNAIVAHAQAVVSSAQGERISPIPGPAAGAYTGVPAADLRRWLGYDYRLIRDPVQEFRQAVQDRFYLQATVGIMASALPTLFASRVPKKDPKTVHQAAARAVHQTITKLETSLLFKANSWVKDLKENHRIDYDAFIGLLHLTYAYIVGDAINATNLLDGSTIKNAVPFLSKLEEFPTVKSAAMPQHLRSSPAPEPLHQVILHYVLAEPYHTPEYWMTNWNLEQSARDRGNVYEDADIFKRVLSGEQVDVMGSGHELQNPDPLPVTVRSASENQQGLPLEYRRVSDRPSSAGLPAALMKVVKEVRELNTRHMDPEEKRKLLEAADA